MSNRFAVILAGFILPSLTAAQTAPAIHGLGPTIASIPTSFVAQPSNGPSPRFTVIPLSDGRVMISDPGRRVVLLFDSTLQASTVVLDSTLGRRNSFTVGSMLLPFRGDSTLFFDRTPAVLVVIDPAGTIVRTFPPPTLRPSLITPAAVPSAPGFTGSYPVTSSPPLGVLYRVSAPGPTRPARPGMERDTIRHEDSTYLVRMNHDSRTIDTLTKLSTGEGGLTYVDAVGRRVGGASGVIYAPIFPFFDDAVVTADGSVAILRAREYRLDRIETNGTLTTGRRLPYPWRRISDDERQRIVDSINGLRRAAFDSMLAKRAADSAAGKPPMTTLVNIIDDARTTLSVPAGPPRQPQPLFLDQIPDFHPPVGRNSVMADADNNVWIAPLLATPDPNGTVWEVYDRENRLVDRVLVPTGRWIVAFAKGGIAFVASRDAGMTRIEKVRIKP